MQTSLVNQLLDDQSRKHDQESSMTSSLGENSQGSYLSSCATLTTDFLMNQMTPEVSSKSQQSPRQSPHNPIPSPTGHRNESPLLLANENLPKQVQDEPVSSDNAEPDQTKKSVQTRMKPYDLKAPKSLGVIIIALLSKTGHRAGSLYILSKKSHPGYLKIGRTFMKISKRMSDWKNQCGQDVTLEYGVKDVPYVGRLEKLIHTELGYYRYKEVGCDSKTCASVHTEWFRVDVEVAKAVIDKWVQWINTTQPYNDNGEFNVDTLMPSLSYQVWGLSVPLRLPACKIPKRKHVMDDSDQSLIPFQVTKRATLTHTKSSDLPVPISFLHDSIDLPDPDPDPDLLSSPPPTMSNDIPAADQE